MRLRSAGDETWLRIVDVPAALRARTYAGTGEVRLAVIDERLPENTGTYRISAAGVERVVITVPAPDGSSPGAA